jgi:hypothetical protein
VNLLCKFSDISAEPQPLSYFNGLMSNTYPGMDHYWREVSYDVINIIGSASQNWKTLPMPKSGYMTSTTVNLTALFNDCTAIHNADVYFPNFVGINLMFNGTLDGPCDCAWGGSRTATLDGVTKTYRVTWEPPWGYGNHTVLAHEMGHGWGLPHSSGPYGATYDSDWDVMSGGAKCSPPHPTYGCIGPHTISYHKDILHWIPASRKRTVTLNSSTTITLERLSQPASPTSYLMAQIPIGGSSTLFYTVEARRLVGYDTQVPDDAIVIHHVDTTRERPAWVVDADGNLDGDCQTPLEESNCNPNDAGARWTPGETFVDAANSIQVTVNSSTATGFTVTIISGIPPPACPATSVIFRIERETGNACADGAWNSGGADVAEFISTTEILRPGDVVEVDPQNPKSYRKARSPYSTLVAGVISISPGLILGPTLSGGPNPLPPSPDVVGANLRVRPGQTQGSAPEGWGERTVLSLSLSPWREQTLLLSGVSVSRVAVQMPSERPLLALLGRVPVRATTAENGSIRPGDLLVSASKPGYAMRCASAQQCEGAIIGKALEALEEGEGLILVLVTR